MIHLCTEAFLGSLTDFFEIQCVNVEPVQNLYINEGTALRIFCVIRKLKVKENK